MAASQLQTSMFLGSRQAQKVRQHRQRAVPISTSAARQVLPFNVGISRSLVSASAASTLQEQSVILEKEDSSIPRSSSIEIRTLRNCKLGIAMYPDFVYNADGGGGYGTSEKLSDGKFAVKFDTDELHIPAVEGKTTTFLGLPLPPFLCIQVVPKSLEGLIDRSTGKVELNFCADFLFSVGSLYKAPPLVVNALLTTETAAGRLRSGHGQRLNSEGKCKLVGVAPLVPIEDVFMNAFLTLPTDCLAIMEAQFVFH
ncbi:hypothetical protein KP509_12G021000 [Ceratopteris richardii]|uniref:Uncharacterized protein n=1 Tax=Ceratopteris richardii TaxID=49495 RepID=A0A8T2TH97_CERRI|nr:hypothetical protein KP509_12G021000 [Ceratopteris richardii]